MVEHDLAKVGVAGSSPVFRSGFKADSFCYLLFFSKKSVSPGGGTGRHVPINTGIISNDVGCFKIIVLSKDVCPGGGTGRHAGLKILFAVMRVTVQFRSRVPIKKLQYFCSFFYFGEW